MKKPEKTKSPISLFDKMIAAAISGHFYGSEKGPRQMRDEYYRNNAAYRRAEDELAPHLQALGAVELWRKKQNARVSSITGARTFDLQMLPKADEWECFKHLTIQLYVPKGAEEVEQPEGVHLEIELMNEDQTKRAKEFTRKQSRVLAEKEQYLGDVLEYRRVMKVPKEMSLAEWKAWLDKQPKKKRESIAAKP